MVRRAGIATGSALVAIAAVVAVLLLAEHDWVAYVVCSDKRIYELDLAGGRILRVSDPVRGMGSGGETDIAYSAGVLYVGTQRGKQDDFDPLLAIDVAGDFEVVGTHRFGVEFGRAYWTSDRTGDIYGIVLSPSGDQLFVMAQPYGGPPYTPKWPASKGLAKVVVRGGGNMISHDYEFSPDGASVASLWPERRRTTEDEGGERITWHVSTRDVAGGEWSREAVVGNRGLHTPWGRLEGPLVHVRRDYATNTNRIELYDRDSRERIAEIDVTKTTGLLGGNRPEMLEGTDLLAITGVDPADTVGYDLQGYVLVLDIVTEEVISKVRVGPGPSNIVVVKRAGPVRRLILGR